VGTPFFPVVGTIVGACLGSFAGAFLIELAIGRTHEDSLKIGMGAAKGRFMGIIGKLAFGIAMLFVALIAAFPTGGPAMPTAAPSPATTVPATTQPGASQPATAMAVEP